MTDQTKYCAEECSERMLLEGDSQASRIILDLLKQRAELLEALKRAEKKIVGICNVITDGYGEEFVKNDGDVINIRVAITNAEK